MPRVYKHPPDGGYSWVIVLVSHVCLMISGGITTSLGMFLPMLMINFDESSDAVVNLITALTVCLVLGLGPVSSALSLHFGCRAIVMIGGVVAMAGFMIASVSTDVTTLAFGIGILGGSGLGLVLVPSITIVGCYFTTNYVKANAISSAGVGVGSVVFPLIFNKLITLYGWRGAAAVTGGICLQICVFGSLIRPIIVQKDNDLDRYYFENGSDRIIAGKKKKDANNAKDHGETESSQLIAGSHWTKINEKYLDVWMECVKDELKKNVIIHWHVFVKASSFYLLGFACMFYSASFFIFLLNLPKIVIDLELPTYQAAISLSASGLASTILRAMHYPLVTQLGAPPLPFFLSSLIVMWIPLLCFPLLSSFATITLAAVVIGIGIGIAIPLTNVVAKQVVPMPHYHALAIGYLYMFMGSGQVIAGYFGGLMGEVSGNYKLAVMFAGVLNSIAVTLTALLYRQQRMKSLELE